MNKSQDHGTSALLRANSSLHRVSIVGNVRVSLGASRRPAHEQIPVGLPILGRHHHIYDGIDARGQVDEQVAHDVHHRHSVQCGHNFRYRDGKIADQKRNKYDHDHFEQTPVFGCHATRIENGRARCVHGRRFANDEAAHAAAGEAVFLFAPSGASNRRGVGTF